MREEAWLSFAWPDGQPSGHNEVAVAYARLLLHELERAGYRVYRLEVRLRWDAPAVVDLSVRAEVPGLQEVAFVRLAREAVRRSSAWKRLPDGGEVRLHAALLPSPAAPTAASGGRGAAAGESSEWAVRVGVAVVLGLVLGVLGLPRLTPQQGDAVPAPPTEISVVPTAPVPAIVLPPAPTPTPGVSPLHGVIFDANSAQPLQGWPNDPTQTAWFADGSYHIVTNQPGQFVAIGAPLPALTGDAVVSAAFRKTGGPPGGGYGLVVRCQGDPASLDGAHTTGDYLVAEVSDRGEVSLWRRSQTRWLEVVPWTATGAVQGGTAVNELAVALHGDGVQLEVNHQVVVPQVAYPELPPHGAIGLFASGDRNEVAVDWLKIDPLSSE